MTETAATTTTPAEGTTGTTTPQTSTLETPPFDISKYIEPDGKLKEGWKEGLVPEELRTNKFYDIFHDLQGILKSAGHQAVTLGKYGATKGVLPINEKSTSFEVQAFRDALGVPKDGAGYKYTAPDDISIEDLSPEFMKETFDTLNKSHFTQGQVDTVMKLYVDHLKLVEKTNEEELAKLVSDTENQLRAEWGDNFEARKGLAEKCITDLTKDWSREKYENLFGKEITLENGAKSRQGGINDAEFAPLKILFLDLFATLSEKYGVQGSALESETTGGGAKSIDVQIEEVEATPGFMDGKLRGSMDSRDRAKYEELIKQRDALYKRKFPV